MDQQVPQSQDLFPLISFHNSSTKSKWWWRKVFMLFLFLLVSFLMISVSKRHKLCMSFNAHRHLFVFVFEVDDYGVCWRRTCNCSSQIKFEVLVWNKICVFFFFWVNGFIVSEMVYKIGRWFWEYFFWWNREICIKLWNVRRLHIDY